MRIILRLIEGLLIIAIVGVLGKIAVDNYHAGQQVKQNSHTLQLVVEYYAVTHHGVLPARKQITQEFFPNGIVPVNPYTNKPVMITDTNKSSPGDLGYQLADGIYTIEGYGKFRVEIVLSNG